MLDNNKRAEVKRIQHPDRDSHVVIDITPEMAHWKYISFKVLRLAKGQTIEADSATQELALVPLVGRGSMILFALISFGTWQTLLIYHLGRSIA